jgi:hypothetical protein
MMTVPTRRRLSLAQARRDREWKMKRSMCHVNSRPFRELIFTYRLVDVSRQFTAGNRTVRCQLFVLAGLGEGSGQWEGWNWDRTVKNQFNVDRTFDSEIFYMESNGQPHTE